MGEIRVVLIFNEDNERQREEDAGKVIEEEQSDGLDMDEGMLMAGLSMFENGF